QSGSQLAEGFAEIALDAVALDRTGVDLARHRQAEARRMSVMQPVQCQQGRGGALALLEHEVELRTRPYPRLARETEIGVRGSCAGSHVGTGNSTQAERTLRPLARRRARILRPSAVFMRARKPWSRLRLRLLGWWVRLVAMAGTRAVTRRKEPAILAAAELAGQAAPCAVRLRSPARLASSAAAARGGAPAGVRW